MEYKRERYTMKRTRKIFFLIFCLALIFTLTTACSQKTKTSSDSLADGTITFGVCANHAPMAFTDDKQNVIGFEIDLGNAIAKELNVNPYWINTSWNSIFDRMNRNKYDCVLSSVTDTPSREDNFSLSNRYFVNNIVILKKSKTDDEAVNDSNETLKDLKDKQVGVVVNSGGAGTAKAHLDNRKVKKFNSLNYAVKALKNDMVDRLIIDESEAIFYIKKYPNQYEITSHPIASENYSIVCRKDNEKLTRKINRALKHLIDNGTYAKLTEKWFDKDMTSSIQ